MSTYKGPHMLAVYRHLDLLIEGIRTLKKSGMREFMVISPVPHHDIEHELHGKKSPVRVFTLIGGLTGFVTGWVLTIGSTNAYPLIVGGKPLISIPPFGIIAYILTILFGALATLLGFFLNSRLPQFVLRDAYDERLSSDHFGIQVFCPEPQMTKVEEMLKDTGAIDFIRNTEHVAGKKEFVD
jgi:hypothetical protein